ncbi:cytochrome c1-like [Drosophila obscura]|uniref:cytochrome c1-like n=1 Tax=Drosophila obscura TaxID=7282 RepID=UPI001BB1BDFF|nr:cytochrome c1-like [Drosophila obscura]
MASSVDFPFLKPYWPGERPPAASMAALSLVATTFSKTFPMVSSRQMGLRHAEETAPEAREPATAAAGSHAAAEAPAATAAGKPAAATETPTEAPTPAAAATEEPAATASKEPAADTETATPATRPPAEAIRRSHMEQQHSRRAAAEARREEERRRGEERRREEEARRKAAEKAQREAALNKVIMREARDALQRQMEAARREAEAHEGNEKEAPPPPRFLQGCGIHHDVVHVYEATFPQQLPEKVIHHSLERRWGITEPKRHPHVFEVTPFR